MDYALITDPNRPHYGEVGRAEIFYDFFITVQFSADPFDFEVYFSDEVRLFWITSPSITSPLLLPGPNTVM